MLFGNCTMPIVLKNSKPNLPKLSRLTTDGWNFATKKDNITLSSMVYTMQFKKLSAFFAFAFLFSFATAAPAEAQRGLRQEKLLNGLRVLMWPNPAADKVELKLRIHAGASFDPQGREGTMKMLAESLFADQAARDFFAEDLGGSLSITTTHDYIQIDASSRPEQYLTLLEMIATAVSNPVIDREMTEKARTRVMAEYAAEAAKTDYIADAAVSSRLLGTFPYGRPVLGTKESLNTVDFADLRFNYDRLFGADNATLAVSGKIDSNAGYRAVRRFFGNWLKSDETIPATFKQPEAPPAEVEIITSEDVEEEAVRVALRGVSRGSKEYAAAEILSRIYESRLSSKTGGNVAVNNEARFLPGMVVFEMQGDVSDATAAIRSVLDTPVSEAEFTSHRTATVAARATSDIVVQWLDAHTFRYASPKEDVERLTGISLAEVRVLADRLKAAPMAIVAVTKRTEAASEPAVADKPEQN